jgi:hypothetical protein
MGVGGLREQERSGHQIARRAEGGEYKRVSTSTNVGHFKAHSLPGTTWSGIAGPS